MSASEQRAADEAMQPDPGEGSHSAEEVLWLRWHALRPRVVGSLVLDGWAVSDAEDLFGAALLRAWERRGRLTDVDRAEAWFWSLARRLAIDDGRRESRTRRRRVDTLPETLPAAEGTEAPCACSLEALAQLPEHSRRLVEAVDLGGAAVRDVARRDGISANSASVRLYRARHALRRQLEAMCGTTSVIECQDCGCPPTATVTS